MVNVMVGFNLLTLGGQNLARLKLLASYYFFLKYLLLIHIMSKTAGIFKRWSRGKLKTRLCSSLDFVETVDSVWKGG